jgi:hypothetical protein
MGERSHDLDDYVNVCYYLSQLLRSTYGFTSWFVPSDCVSSPELAILQLDQVQCLEHRSPGMCKDAKFIEYQRQEL